MSAIPTIPFAIIEDEIDNAQDYQKYFVKSLQLNEINFQYEILNEVDQFVLWLKKVNTKIGVYLVDLNLGKGKEDAGFQIIDKLQETAPNSIVFVFSNQEDKKDEVIRKGVEFIPKGTLPNQIKSNLKRIENKIREYIFKLIKNGFSLEKSEISLRNSNSVKYGVEIEFDYELRYPSLHRVKSQTVQKFWQDSSFTPSKSLIKAEKQFIVKKLIYNKSKGLSNFSFRGSVSAWKKIRGKTESSNPAAEIQFSDIPNHIHFERNKSGIIKKLSINKELNYSFKVRKPEEWINSIDKDRAFNDIVEHVIAYNLSIVYLFRKRGEADIDIVIKNGECLSEHGRKNLMKWIFSTRLKSILTSREASDPKSKRDLLHQEMEPFYKTGAFPKIIDIDSGEVLAEKGGEGPKKIVVVKLTSWLSPYKAPRKDELYSKPLTDLGIQGVNSYFLLTTYQYLDKAAKAEIELADAGLANEFYF